MLAIGQAGALWLLPLVAGIVGLTIWAARRRQIYTGALFLWQKIAPAAPPRRLPLGALLAGLWALGAVLALADLRWQPAAAKLPAIAGAAAKKTAAASGVLGQDVKVAIAPELATVAQGLATFPGIRLLPWAARQQAAINVRLNTAAAPWLVPPAGVATVLVAAPGARGGVAATGGNFPAADFLSLPGTLSGLLGARLVAPLPAKRGRNFLELRLAGRLTAYMLFARRPGGGWHYDGRVGSIPPSWARNPSFGIIWGRYLRRLAWLNQRLAAARPAAGARVAAEYFSFSGLFLALAVGCLLAFIIIEWRAWRV